MPEGTALIGISTTGRAIAVDLDGESPHVLDCTATGGGSTTVLRSLTAQFLHQGAHALVLDVKRIFHLWAKALPTVTHRGNTAGIHDALVDLADEVKRRNELPDVPRLIVAIDSANGTLHQLARYWEVFRQQDDPRRPRPSPRSRRPSGRGARPASTSSWTARPRPAFSERRPTSCSPP
ncbi:hypothetical protein ACWLMY_35860 [Streptomyces anulatus]